MISCLVVIATVCFHDVGSVTILDTGLSVRAHAAIDDVQADVDVRTDQILSLDWRKLPGSCGGSFCIAYFKKCTENEKGVSCQYHYAFLGDSIERTFSLTGKNTQQIQLAEHGISIVSPLGLFMGEIPLSTLSLESALSSPPYCRAGGPLADCWPKEGR